jgi:hypothetical protein
MSESFQTILQRYTRNQIANTRTTAQGFGRLAERGSIGAALTFGLLSNQADRAEAQQQQLSALLQGEQLALESRRIASDELRAQSLANLQNSQASKVDLEAALLPEDSRSINTLRLAQAAGAITDAQYRDIQSSILSKYGGAEAQAGIIQKLASANTQSAQARNLNADAAITEATGIAAASQQIRESQGRTLATLQNAGANVQNAESNRISALSDSALTYQRAEGQFLDNQLTGQFGSAEKIAAINATNSGATATLSNATTNAFSALANNSNQQFSNVTQRQNVQGNLAVEQARLSQDAAFGHFDRRFNVAKQLFDSELRSRQYNDDKQRRRFEILGTQIGAINDLDTLKKQRELLSEGIQEARDGPWYNVFGLFSDTEKEEALLEARGLLDRKINLFEQALQ